MSKTGVGVPRAASFLLENPLKLYRDFLRLADYVSFEQGHRREAMRDQVRRAWRLNKHLTNEEAIQRAREAAVKALSNSFAHFAMVKKGLGKGTSAEEEEER